MTDLKTKLTKQLLLKLNILSKKEKIFGGDGDKFFLPNG